MIAYTPTSAAIEDAADTPTGRHSTSGAGTSGAHSAVEIMARIDPDVPSWLHLQDSLAKWRATRGKPARAGLHATKCPYAESAGHAAECTFDTRMHGAVLVRPTGERVAA